MKRRQYLLLITLTVIAGLIGGAVSNWLFMARTAEAQETKNHEKVVIAEEFRLVDKDGKKLALLGKPYGLDQYGLRMYDDKGNVCISLKGQYGMHQDPGLYIASYDERSPGTVLIEPGMLSVANGDTSIDLLVIGKMCFLSLTGIPGIQPSIFMSTGTREGAIIKAEDICLLDKDDNTLASIKQVLLSRDRSPR